MRIRHVTSNHTWHGCTAHLLRTDGRLVRCTINDIIFDSYGIYARVKFLDGKCMKTKDVSLLMLLSLQILWLQVDIMSDEEDSTEPIEVSSLVTEKLPVFRLTQVITLDKWMLQAYTCLYMQLDGLSTCVNSPLLPMPIKAVDPVPELRVPKKVVRKRKKRIQPKTSIAQLSRDFNLGVSI